MKEVDLLEPNNYYLLLYLPTSYYEIVLTGVRFGMEHILVRYYQDGGMTLKVNHISGQSTQEADKTFF